MKIYRYFNAVNYGFKNIFDTFNSLNIDLIIKTIDSTECKFKHHYNREYLEKRVYTEKLMKKLFLQKGGFSNTDSPFYFVLENCDEWFIKQKHFPNSIAIDLNCIDKRYISFTYGDSIPTFDDQFNNNKEYHHNIYTFDEILKLIEKYDFPQKWNACEKYGYENYIEVQVWDKNIYKLLNLDNFGNFYLDFWNFEKYFNFLPISYDNCLKIDDCFCLLRKSSNINLLFDILDEYMELGFKLDSMHDYKHSLKVMLFSLVLAEKHNLNDKEIRKLLIASCYHDVGRSLNNGLSHSKNSELIITKLFENNNEISDLCCLVSNHEAKNINKVHKKLKNPLMILKDSDSLDFARFGNNFFKPDFYYLETKKLVLFAFYLNFISYNIEEFYKFIKDIIFNGK